MADPLQQPGEFDPNDCLTVTKAVEQSGKVIRRSKMYEYMNGRQIDSYKVGRSRFVSRRSLLEFLQKQLSSVKGATPIVPGASPPPTSIPQDLARVQPPKQEELQARLNALLATTQECAYSVYEYIEWIRAFDEAVDQDETAEVVDQDEMDWCEFCRESAEANLDRLARAVQVISQTPADIRAVLRSATTENITFAFGSDGRGKRRQSIARPTAYETLHDLATSLLHRSWEAADPTIRQTTLTHDDPREFPPKLVVERGHDVAALLLPNLPEFDLEAVIASLCRESARAGGSGEPQTPSRSFEQLCLMATRQGVSMSTVISEAVETLASLPEEELLCQARAFRNREITTEDSVEPHGEESNSAPLQPNLRGEPQVEDLQGATEAIQATVKQRRGRPPSEETARLAAEVISLKDEKGLSFGQIAYKLNKRVEEAKSGKTITADGANKLYNRSKKRKKGM